MTITEIARRANVSVATVSKVLNGKDRYISEETRQRILAIAQESGYVPNALARSLRSKTSLTLGVIIPDVMNPFFAELARGVEDAAEKRGYSVILCNSDNQPEKSDKYLQVLQEKMVDGIILTASEEAVSASQRRRNTPMVLLDRDVSVPGSVGRVTVDNRKSAATATNHLIERGCKRIGFISSNQVNRSSSDRLAGYRDALASAGLPFDPDLVFLQHYTIDTGIQGVTKLIEQSIDGLCCGNDLIAIGAIRTLKELGHRVPEDIKVIGFDDILLSEFIDPPLTTIRQPIYELGYEAVEMLLGMIENKPVKLNQILETTLVERKSC